MLPNGLIGDFMRGGHSIGHGRGLSLFKLCQKMREKMMFSTSKMGVSSPQGLGMMKNCCSMVSE
jgi:hypothetical protein